MSYTIFLISLLLVMVLAFCLFKYFGKSKSVIEEHHHDHAANDGGCCGRHLNCEKGKNGEGLYFDDEELDRFKGVKAEEYTDEDAEEFRHVLYTMNEYEVDTWVQCLNTRGIELPDSVREDVLMILRK